MVQAVEPSPRTGRTPEPTPEPRDRGFDAAMAEQRRGEREAGSVDTAAAARPAASPGPLVGGQGRGAGPTPTAAQPRPSDPGPTPGATASPETVTVPTREEAEAAALDEQRAGEREHAGRPEAGDEVTVPTREQAEAAALEAARQAHRAGERDPGQATPPATPTVGPVPPLTATRPSGITTQELDLPPIEHGPPAIGPMPPERQDQVSRLYEALRPDFYSIGVSQTAPAAPVKGVALMQVPWGRLPWEESPTTGQVETTFIGNLRTSEKLGNWSIGLNGQLGVDPVRGAGGVAFAQGFDNPVMPFTVIGTTRLGVKPDTNQTVVSFGVGVNTPIDAVVSRGLFVGAGVAAAIPGAQPAAAAMLRAGYAVDQAGRTLGQTLPRPVVGVGWGGELRWTNGFEGSPPSFDGLYRRGERVDLPDFVEDAIEQENAGAFMPEAGPVGSFAARVATNAMEALPPAAGLPPASQWDDAVPEALRPGLGIVAESIAEETMAPTLGIPSPFGFARRLAENVAEEGLTPFMPPGATGWAETLLGLEPQR